jgi:hypothetical protein
VKPKAKKGTPSLSDLKNPSLSNRTNHPDNLTTVITDSVFFRPDRTRDRRPKAKKGEGVGVKAKVEGRVVKGVDEVKGEGR